MLLTQELDYVLPDGRIATQPAEPRDSARLMAVRRSGEVIRHAIVRDLGEFLRSGDLLIVNASKVLPAWLEGHRVGTGGKINGLYLGMRTTPAGEHWVVMLRGKHLHEGVRIWFERNDWEVRRPPGEPQAHDPSRGIEVELIERVADEPGAWLVRLHKSPDAPGGVALLERTGSAPVPPYIRHARKAVGLPLEMAEDQNRYQTVYADSGTVRDGLGSVAAPTAGLHFTTELLRRLEAQGVERRSVTLHVGSGTFKPIETDFVEEHPIHSEWCSMEPEVLEAILATRKRGGRVIAVGTTAARTIESYARRHEEGKPWATWIETRLLITPGHRWRWIDGLMTNFHLPQSSLLALTAAMFEGGVPALMSLYREAIEKGYRFYSYGDAMLILP